MIIRSATVHDARAIAAFWNPMIRETAVTFTSQEKTAQGLAADIVARQADEKAFLVADEAGKVLGFATYAQFRNGPGYAHSMEHSVILAPPAQGRGVGRALLSAVEDHARARGVHSMIAGVSSENPAALRFHEKLGYAEVGRLPEVGSKFGCWMDLVLLQKLL